MSNALRKIRRNLTNRISKTKMKRIMTHLKEKYKDKLKTEVPIENVNKTEEATVTK